MQKELARNSTWFTFRAIGAEEQLVEVVRDTLGDIVVRVIVALLPPPIVQLGKVRALEIQIHQFVPPDLEESRRKRPKVVVQPVVEPSPVDEEGDGAVVGDVAEVQADGDVLPGLEGPVNVDGVAAAHGAGDLLHGDRPAFRHVFNGDDVGGVAQVDDELVHGDRGLVPDFQERFA